MDCGYLLEPTIHVLNRNMKNISIFYLNNFLFCEVIFSVYLNRRAFVMEPSVIESLKFYFDYNIAFALKPPYRTYPIFSKNPFYSLRNCIKPAKIVITVKTEQVLHYLLMPFVPKT